MGFSTRSLAWLTESLDGNFLDLSFAFPPCNVHIYLQILLNSVSTVQPLHKCIHNRYSLLIYIGSLLNFKLFLHLPSSWPCHQPCSRYVPVLYSPFLLFRLLVLFLCSSFQGIHLLYYKMIVVQGMSFHLKPSRVFLLNLDALVKLLLLWWYYDQKYLMKGKCLAPLTSYSL